jgi:hypothetical protein
MSVYGAAASRERPGWFVGLTGPQILGVVLGAVPAWGSVATGEWVSLMLTIPMWLVLTTMVCVPIRGWSALQWCGVVLRHAWGVASGISTFQSRASAADLSVDAAHHKPHHLDLADADLPGVLSAIDVHSVCGPNGLTDGLGLIQDHARHTWAATARLTHPGIGLSDESTRSLMGSGLTGLLEAVAASDAVRLLVLHVRATPETRADRSTWVRAHAQVEEPEVSAALHEQLDALTASAAVRHEAYLTVVVSDRQLARGARRSGRGVEGRARLMHPLLAEVEGHLLGATGCTNVRWLASDELAIAVRTGFEPGDGNPSEWATTGPSSASTSLRSYQHGDWLSCSSTLLLPRNGALMGALARVLVPDKAGERRSMSVLLRPVGRRAAQRTTERSETSAAMGAELRRRVGRDDRARDRRAAARLRDTDEKIERGRALVKVGIVATTTVPASWDSLEAGRRLDAAARMCGFLPVSLDGAQDAAFAAAAMPLGSGLPNSRARS